MKAAKIALLGAVIAGAVIASAQAQSSLGIGAAEQALPPSGLFPSLMHWINTQQQEFYRALTGALRAMRADASAAWLLVGLSFAYGVFHAAGPGHGKAVISSYMLANEVALRRGVVLSLVSAMLQAVTAILVVGAVFLFLRGTGSRHQFRVARFALDEALRDEVDVLESRGVLEGPEGGLQGLKLGVLLADPFLEHAVVDLPYDVDAF